MSAPAGTITQLIIEHHTLELCWREETLCTGATVMVAPLAWPCEDHHATWRPAAADGRPLQNRALHPAATLPRILTLRRIRLSTDTRRPSFQPTNLYLLHTNGGWMLVKAREGVLK